MKIRTNSILKGQDNNPYQLLCITNTTFYYKIYLYNTPIYERLTSNLTNHI